MLFDFSIGQFILMYHSIGDYPKDPYSVTVDAFREQISWLAGNGYEVVSLSDLLRAVLARNNKALRKKVVITFDDGYKDFIDNALPILTEHGATATMFLVTGMLGEKASWDDTISGLQLMTEDEVLYIKSQGISLGSHTATHANLTLVNHDELQRQLTDSHVRLEQLGESFFTLSYPWGRWSGKVVDAVKSCGFECALAVGEHTRISPDNAFSLPRVTMRRDIDLNRFQVLMSRSSFERSVRWLYGFLRRSMSRRPVLSGDRL